jgi:DNA-binding CsgD family transcriptional regulator
MVKYVITLVFVLSAALASGSIVISSRLRSRYKPEIFGTLIYYQIFYFTYGFYAIWGQVFLYSFLSPFLSGELLNRVTNILVLIGSPFVILTWLMLIRLTRELSGREIRIPFVLQYVILILLLVSGAGYLLSRFEQSDLFTIIKYCFVLLNFTFTITGIVYLLSYKKHRAVLRKRDMKNIAMGLLMLVFLQNAFLLDYRDNIYVALGFILLFFMGGAFVPLYIQYQSDLSVLHPAREEKTTFDLLCAKFDITAREKEIIREICKGLSNQQIADALFISLQTVKDHTSRIYYKINCTSRAQLIAMVNGARVTSDE